MSPREIIAELLNDRVIQAGVGSSSVTFVGAAGMTIHPLTLATMLADVQPWIAFLATLFGGLASLAAFVYACLKIRRMIQNPKALD